MSVVVLTGGVGGAKLVDGLAQVLPDGQLSAVVNTADDFTHLGLRICPDIDSVLYMLAGKSDPVRGWGVSGESWNFMAALAEWQGEAWFNLGDRDLAMHVMRTEALAAGDSLTSFSARMTKAAGVAVNILPMSEDTVATIVETGTGKLPFQHYFVKHRCEPVVREIRFDGADRARPSEGVLAALADASLEAIILAPSNPYLSIDPILSVPGLGAAMKEAGVPVVAVSPIIGGKAVKGPTAKLMGELGVEVSNASIAAHYAGLIDGLLVDSSDSGDDLPVRTMTLDTLMNNATDRKRVAEAALTFARALR